LIVISTRKRQIITSPQSLTITPLRELPAWKALEAHHANVRNVHLRQLFAEDPQRAEHFTMEAVGLYFDCSKNHITNETARLLIEFAEESGLREHIGAMFRGGKINVTEGRAVLHVALRAPDGEHILVDGVDAVKEIHTVLDEMTEFVNRIRSGEWKGHTGKRIRNLINIGIGGSDLGPVIAYEALKYYSLRDMTFRFVSNVDGTDLAEATRDLNAEETLFVVSSETFTTLEAMTNARSASDWALKTLKDEKSIARHFVAVSTNAAEVKKFGIDTANMFGFWNWVGARYSMDSAIGLSTMITIGPEQFRVMLGGFHAMDEHFRTAPFDRNLPVLLGMLVVWYNDFFDAQTVAVLPYEQYLKRFYWIEERRLTGMCIHIAAQRTCRSNGNLAAANSFDATAEATIEQEGESAPTVHQRICDGLRFPWIKLDITKNDRNTSTISGVGFTVSVCAIPTSEELIIANLPVMFVTTCGRSRKRSREPLRKSATGVILE